MCGIAGIIDRQQTGQDLGPRLKAMTDAIAHRGPDGCGHEIRGPIGIGHRRLSIIDLEGGAQPIWNEAGTLCLTYNGELYNFRELRTELERDGYVFRTRCDTEVILIAYEAWGPKCLERFRGMFAFGIADFARREIFLARDPLGIKPLLYLQTATTFAFASEFQALGKATDERLHADLEAIDEYLFLTFITAPRTAFREIRKLPAGHFARVGFDGGIREIAPYWRMRFQPDDSLTFEEWVEQFEAVERESVEQHLVADVPFGAFLSGGLDSTCVVREMKDILGPNLETFSIGFSGTDIDETSYSETVAQRFQTRHQLKQVELDSIGLLPKLVRHYGEPFADNSAIPTSVLCQTAAERVKMVLSGDGADEAFGGYRRYFFFLQNIYRKPSFAKAAKEGKFIEFWHGEANQNNPYSFAQWVMHHTNFNHWGRTKLWGPRANDLIRYEAMPMWQHFDEDSPLGPAHTAQFADIHTYLPDNICTKVDIASMMHSLEVRTPFTDRAVFEFAARIPEHHNMCPDGGGNYTGKHVMKRMLERTGDFSHDFIHREKAGFGAPLKDWFGSDGPTGRFISERIASPRSLLLELFPVEGLKELFAGGVKGSQVWSLLFLDEWLRQSNVSLDS